MFYAEIELVYLMYSLFISFILAFIIGRVSYIISAKIAEYDLGSAYECGFEPFEESPRPYSVAFYLAGLLFVLFDIEIILLLLWCTVALYHRWSLMMLFFQFLLLGFIFEWLRGAITILLVHIKVLIKLNDHDRMVAFKRQRYWICKKLHVNIYENKKVCTNWVCRILMTEVTYDIVKIFGAAKRAYLATEFKDYVQWLIKRASNRRVVFYRLKLKVRKLLLVSLNNFKILDKKTLNKNIDIKSYTNKKNSRIYINNNLRNYSNSMRSFSTSSTVYYMNNESTNFLLSYEKINREDFSFLIDNQCMLLKEKKNIINIIYKSILSLKDKDEGRELFRNLSEYYSDKLYSIEEQSKFITLKLLKLEYNALMFCKKKKNYKDSDLAACEKLLFFTNYFNTDLLKRLNIQDNFPKYILDQFIDIIELRCNLKNSAINDYRDMYRHLGYLLEKEIDRYDHNLIIRFKIDNLIGKYGECHIANIFLKFVNFKKLNDLLIDGSDQSLSNYINYIYENSVVLLLKKYMSYTISMIDNLYIFLNVQPIRVHRYNYNKLKRLTGISYISFFYRLVRLINCYIQGNLKKYYHYNNLYSSSILHHNINVSEYISILDNKEVVYDFFKEIKNDKTFIMFIAIQYQLFFFSHTNYCLFCNHVKVKKNDYGTIKIQYFDRQYFDSLFFSKLKNIYFLYVELLYNTDIERLKKVENVINDSLIMKSYFYNKLFKKFTVFIKEKNVKLNDINIEKLFKYHLSIFSSALLLNISDKVLYHDEKIIINIFKVMIDEKILEKSHYKKLKIICHEELIQFFKNTEVNDNCVDFAYYRYNLDQFFSKYSNIYDSSYCYHLV